jgi:hypothetical protein
MEGLLSVKGVKICCNYFNKILYTLYSTQLIVGDHRFVKKKKAPEEKYFSLGWKFSIAAFG